MKGFSVSRLLSLAAIVAVAAVCAGAGVARPERPPEAVLTQATGDLRLSNSADGQAIFQASGLAPGGAVTGTVRLTNSGTLPGDLSLQQIDVTDRPGPGGGRLSNVVSLQIADVSGGSSIPVFSGQLAGLSSRPLGAIGPGEARTFRFTATLPDSGNAFAGSGLTVRYAWNATSSGTLGPSGENVPKVFFRVNARRLVKRGWLDVRARCNRGCTLDVRAKAPRRSRVKFRTRVVTLPLPGRTARIRLKLNRRSRRALTRYLHSHRRLPVKVNVRLIAAGTGTTTSHRKRVYVKRVRR